MTSPTAMEMHRQFPLWHHGGWVLSEITFVIAWGSEHNLHQKNLIITPTQRQRKACTMFVLRSTIIFELILSSSSFTCLLYSNQTPLVSLWFTILVSRLFLFCNTLFLFCNTLINLSTFDITSIKILVTIPFYFPLTYDNLIPTWFKQFFRSAVKSLLLPLYFGVCSTGQVIVWSRHIVLCVAEPFCVHKESYHVLAKSVC